ncbi:MAG: protein kinase [Verrucomicrobia bacterium]|nr:protein kinase [Verrucomicrobiota bacterium]
MESGRWRRVENLFHEAADMAPAERSAFLDESCREDGELRREVESLLSADTPEDELLETAVCQAIDRISAAGGDDSELTGQHIGHYLITGLIGQGGMGAVYHAVRADDFYLQVAIKLLKRGTDTEAALSRFRSERQILADLQHPNIARLLDGGATESGLPYLVMEYVDGTPFLEYATALPVRQRIALFCDVCSAVQYAHQHRIVHRDIKPANILVTRDGVPKLLDFGIAKLTDPAGEGSTILTVTAAGMRALTPDYASPEQVRGEPITAATDIYSLGAVLYELLTGQRAHHIETFSPTEIERKICIQEVRKPSAVTKDLDADLDNIVMKALQKEPERRYHSVAELMEDLGYFLHGSRIKARPQSLTFRTRKLVKHHRRLIAVCAVPALLVFAFIEQRANHPRPLAPDQASVAVLPFANLSGEKSQEYFVDGLTDELRNMLVRIRGTRVVDGRSSFQFKGKTGDFGAIGRKLGVATILEGSVRRQANRVRISLDLLRSTDGVVVWSDNFDREIKDIFAVQEEVARAICRELHIRLQILPRSDVSAQAYEAYLTGLGFLQRQNKQDLERAVASFRYATTLDLHYAPAWSGLGAAYGRQVQAGYIPTQDGYRKSQEALKRALLIDPQLPQAHLGIGINKLFYERDWVGAEACFRRASAIAPAFPGLARAAGQISSIMGHLDDAILQYRRSIEMDPFNEADYYNLGATLYYAGRDEEAKAALYKVLEIAPEMSFVHWMLGRVYLDQSNPQLAIKEMRKEQHPAVQLHGYALACYTLGQKKKSDAYFDDLIKNFQNDAPYQIAEVYAFRGELERAFEWMRRAYDQQDPGLMEIKVDPLVRSLRDDPRYKTLLAELRLPL